MSIARMKQSVGIIFILSVVSVKCLEEAGIPSPSLAGFGVTSDPIDARTIDDVPHKLKSRSDRSNNDRIKVPLGRRLADSLADGIQQHDGSSSGPAIRRFEIEVETKHNHDNTTSKRLLVEEIHQTPVTSATTYSFHKDRSFNPSKIKDVTLLASNPNEVQGLTIMSVNKSTGDVKGIQRGKTGAARHIFMDHNSRKLQLKSSSSSTSVKEEVAAKNWTCGAAHAGDDYFHDHSDVKSRASESSNLFKDGGTKRSFHTHYAQDITTTTTTSSSTINDNKSDSATPVLGTPGAWAPPTKHSFHVDLSIDIDKSFIEQQGSTEAAVEYINFLIGAANVIVGNEVDTHLNVVHIQETDLYDELTDVKEALRAQRLAERPYGISNQDSPRIILHHALLGRYLGGGIAFIDSICDDNWGYGVTSDISGSLSNMDELVLFDFFIVTHEIGHSLGSGHTFDAYDPPVDVCGVCTVKEQGGDTTTRNTAPVEGLPQVNAATIMSYCNFCEGGLENIAITLGGVWDGEEPRTEIGHWENHPDIVGDVSFDPRRVSHNIWQRLSSKGECARPPAETSLVQICNDDLDCNDHNMCTIKVCDETKFCAVTEILDNCCGNLKCEPGEGSNCSDCGPFTVKSANEYSCKEKDDCHSLDGFMIDIGLSSDAERRVHVSSITLAYSSPKTNSGATIDVYVTNEGSFDGKEKSSDNWDKLATVNLERYNKKRGIQDIEIALYHTIPLGIGRRGFYFAASEDILLFREGVYTARSEHQVEIHSSRAVSGLFGFGIDGFGLDCEVSYLLDDASFQTAESHTDSDPTKAVEYITNTLGDATSAPVKPNSNRQRPEGVPEVAYFSSTSEESQIEMPVPSNQLPEDTIPDYSSENLSSSFHKILCNSISILSILLHVYEYGLNSI